MPIKKTAVEKTPIDKGLTVTTTNKNNNLEIESRVGRLEGAFETLARDVSAVANNVIELQRGFSVFKDDIQSYIGTATAPKWPIITAFISLILTIIIMAGTLVGFGFSGQRSIISSNSTESHKNAGDIFDLKYTLGKLEQYQSSHIIESQEQFRRIESLEKSDANNDTNIVVASLDAKLIEMFTRINMIKEHVDDIKNWKIGITATSSENFGKLNSMVDRLVNDFSLFSSTTSSNRWTKEDHQHYEVMITEDIKQLRNSIDMLQQELVEKTPNIE